MLKLTVCGAFLLCVFGLVLRAGAGVDGGTMTTYHDAALGLSYQYPAELQPHPELAAAMAKGLAGDGSDPDAQQEAKCYTLPVTAVRQAQAADGVEFGMVVLLRVDHTCLGEPGSVEKLGQAAQLMMKSLGRFGHPVTEDAVHYQLDGHEAYFVQGSAPAKMLGEGKMLHGGSVCALVGTNTVCWLVVDTEYKAMPGLVGTMVTFDGRGAEPLVPKDMVPKW